MARNSPKIQRLLKQNATTKRKYVVNYATDLPHILVELEPDQDPNNPDTVERLYYYYNDLLVAHREGAYSIGQYQNRYFYLHDRLGSVRQIIDYLGNVKNRYIYSPWGNQLLDECETTIENNYLFTGLFYDWEIDAYDARAREYFPYLARFNGYDPVLGNFQEPLTLHQYLYCLNDPVNMIDSDGNMAFVAMMTGTGGATALECALYAGGATLAVYVTYKLFDAIDLNNTVLDLVIAADNALDNINDALMDTAINIAVWAKSRDSSKNEPHGDGGRSLEKARKQIEELEEQLKDATGREAKKIKNKIKRIWDDAQKKKKGETHHKR